jgi:plastocyanin
MYKITLLLLSGLFFAGCIGPFARQDQTPETMESESFFIERADFDDEFTSRDVEVVIPEGAVQLAASDFTFGVDEIRAYVGDELIILVTNEQGVHDFVIDELGINSGLIPVGDTVAVAIPTDQPGEYEYYCSVTGHRDMGMKGTLIIE